MSSIDLSIQAISLKAVVNLRYVSENSMFHLHLGVNQGFLDYNCMGCPYHLFVPGDVNCQHQEYPWRKRQHSVFSKLSFILHFIVPTKVL